MVKADPLPGVPRTKLPPRGTPFVELVAGELAPDSAGEPPRGDDLGELTRYPLVMPRPSSGPAVESYDAPVGVPPGDVWWKQNRLRTSEYDWSRSDAGGDVGEISFPSAALSTSTPVCDGLDGLVSSIDVDGEDDGDNSPLSLG